MIGEGASRERPEPRSLQARTALVAAGVETQGASKVRGLLLARFGSTPPSDFRPPTKSAGLWKDQIGNDRFLRVRGSQRDVANRRLADIADHDGGRRMGPVNRNAECNVRPTIAR